MENHELVTKALSYIKENATLSNITVPDVAFHAGFSIDYFNRIFQAHTGFTVMAYINQARLKRAASLLRNTERSLLDIALDVGYDSHEGFTKAFKRKHGITPREYRSQKSGTVIPFGEQSDPAAAAQFLYANPVLRHTDSVETIDRLLEKNAVRYAYFCGKIKYLGLTPAIIKDAPEQGLLAIGDDRKGGCTLDLLADDPEHIALWLRQFPGIRTVHTAANPEAVTQALKKHQINRSFTDAPCSFCASMLPTPELPEAPTIRPLTAGDNAAIIQWANGKQDNYIRYLLNQNHYKDESALDFGIFLGENLIAVAECGIDDVHGFRFNDCCRIRFADGYAADSLYRYIYTHVANELLLRGILPIDNIQHGKYAQTHGNFTALELGFKSISWEYTVIPDPHNTHTA